MDFCKRPIKFCTLKDTRETKTPKIQQYVIVEMSSVTGIYSVQKLFQYSGSSKQDLEVSFFQAGQSKP